MKTVGGRKVLASRRAKGRNVLSALEVTPVTFLFRYESCIKS